jgi:hypothetical protein
MVVDGPLEGNFVRPYQLSPFFLVSVKMSFSPIPALDLPQIFTVNKVFLVINAVQT